jgi:hypothetical protein
MSEHDDTTMAPRHLPTFRSREDLAEFWDTHTFTDYLSALEPGKAQIAAEVTAPLSEITQVRFDKAADRQLATYAQQRGIRKSTLLRMIALEWLRNQERRAS